MIWFWRKQMRVVYGKNTYIEQLARAKSIILTHFIFILQLNYLFKFCMNVSKYKNSLEDNFKFHEMTQIRKKLSFESWILSHGDEQCRYWNFVYTHKSVSLFWIRKKKILTMALIFTCFIMKSIMRRRWRLI